MGGTLLVEGVNVVRNANAIGISCEVPTKCRQSGQRS